VKFFRAHSLFQDKCKLLKTPECKKYIQYSEQFQGNSVFFKGKRKLLKNVNCEKIFNTVYIHLGAIRVIWASVVCNQDQRRDWFSWHWSGLSPSCLWKSNNRMSIVQQIGIRIR